MNRIFILFNVVPLIVGWWANFNNVQWLVVSATVVILIRSIFVAAIASRVMKRLTTASHRERLSYKKMIKRSSWCFISAVVNLWSLVVWGQFTVLIFVAIVTAIYFNTRASINKL